MAGPTVKLTFAGDPSGAVKAMDQVGESSEGMSSKIRDSGASFDRAGEGIDNTGQKAGDLESGFRGVTDSLSGFAQIAEGDVMAGLTDLAGGAEALAFGLRGVVVPALKSAVGWLGKTRVGALAMAAASGVARAATIVWAAAQRVLNAVMRANPILKIVGLLAILGAAIAVAWQKSETFRRIVRGAFRAVMWPIRQVIRLIQNLIGWIKDAIDWLGTLNSVKVEGKELKGLPGPLGVGLGIPGLHTGGTVPGAPGQDVLMNLQAGERVERAGGRSGTAVLRSDGSAWSNLVLETVRKSIRQQGGDVLVVLGGR